MTSPPIRILLADDHSVVREGIRSLLEQYEDIAVIGEACDGQAALTGAERLNPERVAPWRSRSATERRWS